MRRFFVLAPVALFLVFGTILPFGSEARAEEPAPVRYGLTMGLNMGKFIWPDTWIAALGIDDRLPQPSMRYGWVAEFFPTNPSISIVTGVDYRMTAEKYYVHVVDADLWTARMGTFLTVPVLVRYTLLNRVKGPWPFFEFGPQAAFLLSLTGKDDGSGASSMEMTQYNRRVTMELRGGTGIEFPMGRMFTAVIEAGYEYALTSTTKESINLPVKARNLFFTMGARF
jgi:hypothetical protein